ncbi:S41 family peptidase [Ferruginibacter sp. SUN106]|uniref:S41 family peptidase n=1 Tax=Ferruginibacter sp. SUN106 TaxID=2978348 RepID=UPI003D36FBC3
MKKLMLFSCIAVFIVLSATAQIDAGLFRYPDVSKTQIVFSYGNDIWIMPKEGGTAEKLSSPAGVEIYPKFSPDGNAIAFTGNYDGNKDVYVIPAKGGVPARLTAHGFPDRVVDWTPDGKRVLFASGRESGRDRFNQFYTVAANGGPAEKLPFAYAELGSYSPDGKQMALTFITQSNRNWKRYRGGWKAGIHIFNFASNTSQNISAAEVAGNEFPMWHADDIYFISDRGAELRMNLWKYSVSSKKFEQLTNFKDYDIHFPSAGPDDIVFEQAGKLFLFSFATQQAKTIAVNVVTDKAALKSKSVSVAGFVQHVDISPDGNRVLVEARGDIFSVPAENGFVKNITHSTDANERYPSWSPDGKTIAYWSDQSGENELWLAQPGKDEAPKKVTSYNVGFRYNLSWSPNSKKLIFIDQAMKIKIFDVATGSTTDVDQALRFMHGGCEGFKGSWSPDSRWFTYTRDLNNYHNAVYIYDTQNKKTQQVTDGFYNCGNAVFDTEGKYLYLTTNQSYSPYYSDIDNSFIYGNSTQIAVITLKKATASLLYAKNDTVAYKADEMPAEKKKDTAAKKPAANTVEIDFDGIQKRMVMLPLAAGNYGNLSSVKGKIVYMKYPNMGSGDDAKAAIKFFDIEGREEKNILDNADGYILCANTDKLLAMRGNAMAVIKPQEGQKFDKPLRLNEMEMTVDPMAEWKELFTDAWRMERDYFYDPNMHGVNWNLVKERYLKMIEGALTREEVNFIIGEMIGELNASHTYKGGGDEERETNKSVGYLGVDWQAAGNYYKVKTIIRGAAWDVKERSPLDEPGIDIKEGSYILAVNGKPITTDQEPYAFFQGLAKKTVELTYNSSPNFNGAKTAVVQTMDNEYNLRYLAWVEANRKRVDEATNGEAGYIYVPSTGTDGQEELTRQFNAQWDKKALVIDERFNSGGQIPDRFIEMLNRTPLAYWATRDGAAWPWPPYAHFGPKVMLINGWSGSGGDAFPDYFRKKGLGPLIGARTWGGLIGISGMPSLVDGGSITAPSFRMYNQDGTWFKEGHGVDPDIAVDEDLGLMSKGTDPQLERAITEIKAALKNKGYSAPKQPAYEKRN